MTVECKDCECPKMINRLMFVLLGFAFISVLALFQHHDIGIKAGSKVKLPFTAAEVDSLEFMWVGPSLMILITLFLHLFVLKWYRCEKTSERKACIFKIDSKFAYGLCMGVFFALTPIVLFLFHFGTRGKDLAHAVTGGFFIAGIALSITLYVLYAKGDKLFHPVSSTLLVLFLTYGLAVERGEFKKIDMVHLYPMRLQGIDLSDHVLLNYNFRGMKASVANFSTTNLYRADLRGAEARKANFTRTNLFEANLEGADLGTADFSGANLSRACLRNAVLTNAVLTDANLLWSQLENANLVSSRLDGARLDWADLSGADLRWAALPEAFLGHAMLHRTKLTESRLAGADLSHAELTDACLRFADLNGANLSGARLRNVDLTGADMVAVDFTDARFFGVDLSGAVLKDARNLRPGQLEGACGSASTVLPADVPPESLPRCVSYTQACRRLHRGDAYE